MTVAPESRPQRFRYVSTGARTTCSRPSKGAALAARSAALTRSRSTAVTRAPPLAAMPAAKSPTPAYRSTTSPPPASSADAAVSPATR